MTLMVGGAGRRSGCTGDGDDLVVPDIRSQSNTYNLFSYNIFGYSVNL